MARVVLSFHFIFLLYLIHLNEEVKRLNTGCPVLAPSTMGPKWPDDLVHVFSKIVEYTEMCEDFCF